jgi:rhodanese-related sulfurtransferase
MSNRHWSKGHSHFPMPLPTTDRASKRQRSLLEECLKTAHLYQSRFKAVESLSSEEFLNSFALRDDYVLLDARTAAERKISMIQGAIPLSDFQGNVTTIVCYCTIGYRSGLEATRLKQLWPHATVYNLDGIIAFSHSATNNSCLKLVDPSTGETAQTVHTFASLWNYVDPERFESISFPVISLPFRFLQVGTRVAVLHSQTLWHTLCCGCSRLKSSER